MASELLLSVVAPDKSVVEQHVTSAILPGVEGYFGVLAGHVPLIAALKAGLLEYVDRVGTRHFVYVGGGFADVNGHKVTVVADEAQEAREIDLNRAEESLEEARRALRDDQGSTSKEDAVTEVERAMNRVRAARAAR
jgi:F-type H+-transporting ATPase subunit epsilon